MTPQEMTKQLIDKFMLVNSESVELETGEHELLLSLSQEDANQCALIAVDMIISVIDPETNFATWLYWKEVKQEIELIGK
jgi:hypothetical protein